MSEQKDETNNNAILIKELQDKIFELETDVIDKDGIIQNLNQEIEKLKEELKKPKPIDSPPMEKKTPSKDEVKVKFLLSPAGKFKMPYNVGQIVILNKEVAKEIVEAKYAKMIK